MEKHQNILITNFKFAGINSAKAPIILLSASISCLVSNSF